MSYQGVTDLSRDPGFRDRLAAVLAEQAKAQYQPGNTTKPSLLGGAILKAPEYWGNAWAYLVASEPGFADAYEQDGADGISDGQFLSAVQALWAKAAQLYAEQLPGAA